MAEANHDMDVVVRPCMAAEDNREAFHDHLDVNKLGGLGGREEVVGVDIGYMAVPCDGQDDQAEDDELDVDGAQMEVSEGEQKDGRDAVEGEVAHDGIEAVQGMGVVARDTSVDALVKDQVVASLHRSSQVVRVAHNLEQLQEPLELFSLQRFLCLVALLGLIHCAAVGGQIECMAEAQDNRKILVVEVVLVVFVRVRKVSGVEALAL